MMTSEVIQDKVIIHAVIPDEPGQLYDYHTHGLEAHGHKEFQVLAPGFCRGSVAALLREHYKAVLQYGDRFEAGERVELDGVLCTYEEVAGDGEGEPTRLRIVDIAGNCNCEQCNRVRGDICTDKESDQESDDSWLE